FRARGRSAGGDADHPRVRAAAGGPLGAPAFGQVTAGKVRAAPMTFRLDDGGGLLGRAREHFDWTLFITVAALAVIGVINLYSATSVAHNAHSEDYIQQIYWLV